MTAAFVRIGLLGFGGPAGQIALMHRTLVEERQWISEPRFLHALNFCMLLPGPEAQQLATYTGWLLHGTRGGVIAGGLFVLPGFLLVLVLSVLYASHQEAAWLIALFFGLKAAVLAIVVEALIRIGRRALKSRFDLALAIAAFIAIAVFRVPFPVVVIGAGIVGMIAGRLRGYGGSLVEPAPADRPPPSWPRSLTVLAICLVLWALPVVAAAIVFGRSSIFVDLGVFFSQMAVVTFGGAYAVLAYVAQAAVSTFGWLDAGQMLDGLALAETTPGPLILVLTFVGYLAGFGAATPLPPIAAGLIGALITTWVTFVPSFLWILLGAPYMERIRGYRVLSAGLAGITAAVVGVIASLALFLALHVLFGEVRPLAFGPVHADLPVPGTLNLAALGIFLVAAACLFWWKRGIPLTLAVAAALGLGLAAAGLVSN